jgi:SAM-dependent methyltransferase
VSAFKDYFSKQAAAYADFRPTYPDQLFGWLAGLTPGAATAWDCATGNGQAATGLAPHVERVIATDASAPQLAHAHRVPNVYYARMRAEEAAFPAHTMDVVTVAQALHWFDIPRFFGEVRRVLRRGGVVAAWCYSLVRITPAIDRVIDRYYFDTLRNAWAPERKLVDTGYRGIEFPFAEVVAPEMSIVASCTRDHILGYLRTWSATRVLQERDGRDPVLAVEQEIAPLWPDPHASLDVRWPLSCRVGRLAAA